MHQRIPVVNQGYPAAERAYRDVLTGIYTSLPLDSFGLLLQHDSGKPRAFLRAVKERWIDDGEVTKSVDDVAMIEVTYWDYEVLHQYIDKLNDMFKRIEQGQYRTEYR